MNLPRGVVEPLIRTTHQNIDEMLNDEDIENNTHLQFRLGINYNVLSIFEDEKYYEQSFQWFEKSLLGGNEEAEYHLALYYQNGRFVEKNEEKAFQHFKHSFESGDDNSAFFVFIGYLRGDGVVIDREKAIEVLNICRQKGHPDANMMEEYL